MIRLTGCKIGTPRRNLTVPNAPKGDQRNAFEGFHESHADDGCSDFADIGECGNDGAIFGEIAEGFRITGSFLYADTIQEQTNGGVNEGFKAPGFPDLQATIYAEYDLPAVPGLTLKARAIYQSATPVDADNSREIPSWERFDLGMRYQFSEASGIPLTIDVDVLNVADTAYWRGTQFTEIYTGQPRTLLVTASVDF